jgi:hypothetical protein
MTAVAASSTAMNAVVASSTAIASINANDQAVRIWMLAGTNQVYSNFANVAAVAASSTAMTAIANSKTALFAIWNSEVALSAIRASTTAVTALISSPYTVNLSNTSSNLANPIVTTKSILIQSKCNGIDTFYLADNYSNGVLVGNYSYGIDTSYVSQVIAFSNIRHYRNSNSGYTWYAYIIDCD